MNFVLGYPLGFSNTFLLQYGFARCTLTNSKGIDINFPTAFTGYHNVQVSLVSADDAWLGNGLVYSLSGTNFHLTWYNTNTNAVLKGFWWLSVGH